MSRVWLMSGPEQRPLSVAPRGKLGRRGVGNCLRLSFISQASHFLQRQLSMKCEMRIIKGRVMFQVGWFNGLAPRFKVPLPNLDWLLSLPVLHQRATNFFLYYFVLSMLQHKLERATVSASVCLSKYGKGIGHP